MDLPMPRLAPVTRATRFCREAKFSEFSEMSIELERRG
jgi:hypothetical protein